MPRSNFAYNWYRCCPCYEDALARGAKLYPDAPKDFLGKDEELKYRYHFFGDGNVFGY
jgi:hypothetical protein